VPGLDNIDFEQASLEDLSQQGLGSFDWIASFEVPHHLESPQAGLNAMRELCKPDGGIGVMIYGRWGRLPVYRL
jgi:2-polyprenyl-3-methyl-5-hydroxy-6-metoxy-1,4-benzoquinol methylase